MSFTQVNRTCRMLLRLTEQKFIIALLVLILAFTPCFAFATQAKDSLVSDDLSLKIDGNSSRFRIDEKKGTIELADCIVTSIRAHRTTWEIPEKRGNQEIVQRIFDLFAQAELVMMPKERLTALSRSEWDYYAYAGLAIDFVSPKGASEPPIYQKVGQAYGTLRFEPLDAQTDDSLKDIIYVQLHVNTNKGMSSKMYYVRSKELFDLIFRMSSQNYDVKDLSKAQSLNIYNCWAMMEFSKPDAESFYASVEDQETIKKLVKVFTEGEKREMRLKTAPEWLLRFTMPDGTIKVAYIAKPALAWDWSPMEKWQGSIFLMTGDSLYTIEQTSFEAMLRSIG